MRHCASAPGHGAAVAGTTEEAQEVMRWLVVMVNVESPRASSASLAGLWLSVLLAPVVAPFATPIVAAHATGHSLVAVTCMIAEGVPGEELTTVNALSTLDLGIVRDEEHALFLLPVICFFAK